MRRPRFGDPDQELSRDDGQYGYVSVMYWVGLHPGCGAAAGSPDSGPPLSSASTSSVQKLPGDPLERRAPSGQLAAGGAR